MFFLVSFLIGSIFMKVYGVATKAIVQCYILDLAANEKNPREPLDNCPPEMFEFMLENAPEDQQERFQKLNDKRIADEKAKKLRKE